MISSCNVGDAVLAKMNNVDLGSADAPNIVCIILEKVDDKMFRLGHTSGTIAECFPFHVLTKIDNSAFNLKIEDIPDKEVTLREAIRSVSIDNGQGFKACNCVTGTCGKGTRCTCFKSGLKCNSRCHKGGNNPNCTMKKDISEKMKKKKFNSHSHHFYFILFEYRTNDDFIFIINN